MGSFGCFGLLRHVHRNHRRELVWRETRREARPVFYLFSSLAVFVDITDCTSTYQKRNRENVRSRSAAHIVGRM